MAYILAVTGKGGSGKTTVSAFLIRQLLAGGIKPVLAVDADPNSTLAPLVGLPKPPYIGDIREEILEEKARITGVPKERMLELKLEECVAEGKGFDLVAMGRPEGPGCYCFVNNLLRQALVKLKTNYKATVIDNEAGMEHLSRMNTDAIDCMVLVSEPTLVSARTVTRICELADSLPVKVHRRVLVWNKVTSSGVPDAVYEPIADRQFDATVTLPFDSGVEQLGTLEQSALSAEMPEAFTPLLSACLTDELSGAKTG